MSVIIKTKKNSIIKNQYIESYTAVVAHQCRICGDAVQRVRYGLGLLRIQQLLTV